MTISVPRSRADPGRAARPGPVVDDRTGSAVADLGAVVAGVGFQVERDTLDREMQRLGVDLTRDMNNLRLQVEQIGNPDQAEHAWSSGVENLRASYLSPDENGQPRVHEKNQEAFGIAFDTMRNRHAFSLGKRTLGLRRAEREATFLNMAQAGTQAYATGDETVRAGTLADLDSVIDADVASGRIDAAEGARRKQSFRQDGDNARAIAMIGDDPAGFLEAVENGEFAGLPADIQARYGVQAQNALDGQTKAAASEAEKQRKAEEKLLGDRLAELRAIAGDGREAVDERFLDDDRVKSHPDYAETRAALSLRDEGKLINEMSPAELRVLIGAEKNRPVSHDWETERLTVLQDALALAEEKYASDPIGFAKVQNRDVPAIAEFDPANPGAFAMTLTERREFAQAEVERGFTEAPTMLSDAERETLAQSADKEADPNTRLALVNGLLGGLPPADAADLALEISDDPVFAHVTRLVGAGMNPSTARRILDGQTKLAQKTVILPSQSEILPIFHDLTDGAFEDQNDLTQAVLGSAMAIYAAEHPAADATTVDNTAFENAIQRALGGTVDTSGRVKAGGLQWFETQSLFGNDYQVPLPPNIPVDRVKASMAAIRADLTDSLISTDPDYRGGPTVNTRKGVGTSRLTAASPFGQVPDFGDPDADGYDPGEIFGQLRLDPYWPDGQPVDAYQLYRNVGGRRRYLTDTEGRPFVVTMKGMMEATR